MAVSVEQAACNALKQWLASQIAGVTFYDRWPEPDLQLAPKTVAVMLAGKPRDELALGERVVAYSSIDPTTGSYSWRFGTRWHAIRLELWAQYDHGRDDLLTMVEAALRKGPRHTLGIPNGDPVRDGVLLALSDGHDGHADFTFDPPERHDDPEGIRAQEHRASIDGEVGVDLIVKADSPKLLTAVLRQRLTELNVNAALVDLYSLDIATGKLTHT